MSIYPNRHKVIASGKNYINLTPQDNSADYRKPPVVKVRKIAKASFYITEKKPSICATKGCANNSLKQVFVVFKGKKGKKCIQDVKQCSRCNAYYLQISLMDMYNFTYDVINADELPEIRANIQRKKEEKAEKKRLKIEPKSRIKETRNDGRGI